MLLLYTKGALGDQERIFCHTRKSQHVALIHMGFSEERNGIQLPQLSNTPWQTFRKHFSLNLEKYVPFHVNFTITVGQR